MNAFEEIELTKFMENCLHESIEQEYPEFYKSCSFEDYEDGLVKTLYDEDGNELGEGIDYISNVVVITSENYARIKELFEIARDNEVRNFIENN